MRFLEFLEVILPTYHEMRYLLRSWYNVSIVRRSTGELPSQWLHCERSSGSLDYVVW